MKRSRDFASSRITLEDGTVLTKCDQCRTMHGERNPPTEPPCDGCMVDLDPENEDAAKIFQLVQGQIITRHNGQHDEIIDLNYPAVKIMMDLYQIRNQRDTFERVLSVFHFFLNERKDS